ncbi:sirohydrochlorin chelatase [Kroppenstedtia eburnea]|uniref:Sirohydrochlorin cobaltochelatase n=1 Tax=Kroppenstedtia eburnea TaxID=714067 RepID=A0A1N7MKC2_9BACL|nr:sirohydrochlorin chelatase [Kroppenstedtia eburnea]EGK07156.1 sirohydrochlorin cobaltochelatase [Desmospora sp. 8437]QKI81620.1 sirohydrochlorin chelatase [Kroppenstedtia eburnea]SIS86391.1 sirohydrochlorin cobaltochelatase [Kroppenstedtia eburnea]
MKVILWIGHGSRDPEGCRQFREMVLQMQKRLPDRRMECCFLEFETPDVQAGVDRCVAQGATEVTAIPVLLLDALHFTKDIPGELASARKRHPHLTLNYGAHLGFHERMLEVLLAGLLEAGEDPLGENGETAVLMVGLGSSDPVANSNFFKLARMLWERTSYEWVECSFISLTQPRLETGVERCLRLGAKQVIVLPYFLFTGKLYKRVVEIIRRKQEQHPDVPFRFTSCFGLNPLVLEVLEQRVAEAEAGTFTAYDHDWMRGLAQHRYGGEIP